MHHSFGDVLPSALTARGSFAGLCLGLLSFGFLLLVSGVCHAILLLTF
jgi:hypothetical protein